MLSAPSPGPVMQRVFHTEHLKLGFEGYNSLKTKSFPNGQPNLLIARRLERGSSVSKAHPIIKPAVKATKGICEQNMKQSIDESIKKLMK